MSCPYCAAAAKDWAYGLMQAACPGCVVRDVARCPDFIRQAEYRLCPPDQRAEFVEQVNAERRRIRDLRAAAGQEHTAA